MNKKEMTQPLISIVIPVYNAEKYIRKCIDSILFQTYTKWELILINDGSADDSGKICNRYAEKDGRIKVIHQPNGGVGNARNTGIEQASGDFITFIDADDWIEYRYLMEFIHRDPQPESIIVSGLLTQNIHEVYVSFNYDNIQSSLEEANKLIVQYDLFKDGGPCNKLYDLALIKQNNLKFRVDISYHEDHVFIYEYYLLINIIILSRYSGYHYVYYGNESNSSLSRLGKRNINNLFNASDAFLNLVPRLFERYNITDSIYKSKVLTRTGFSQRILALYNLYFYSTTPGRKCKEILDRERTRTQCRRRFYYNPTVKRKLFMYILFFLPLNVSHALLIFLRISTPKREIYIL